MQISYRVAALCLLVAPTFSLAQGKEPLSQPSVVPIDLAAALISSGGIGGSDGPRILIGSAPEWIMPKIVIPDGGRLLGAAFQGTAVLTIVNIPRGGDSTIALLRKPLMEHGWFAPPVAPPPNYGGFRPALPTPSDAPPTRLTFCDGAQQLNVSVARRDAASIDVAYRIFAWSGVGGACNPPQMPASMTTFRSPYPGLYNPNGTSDARMTGECSTTLGGSSSTGTTLRTAMPADAILDHYAKQLADSGWKPQADRGVTIGRTFVRDDPTGAPMELSLTVTTSARMEGCRDVNMTARTGRKP